jgi:hypothetical protein
MIERIIFFGHPGVLASFFFTFVLNLWVKENMDSMDLDSQN